MRKVMHRRAGGIAKRFLEGGDTPENRRLVEKWAQGPAEKSPIEILRDGRTLYVWEEVADGEAAQ
jgi:hypothetical protein